MIIFVSICIVLQMFLCFSIWKWAEFWKVFLRELYGSDSKVSPCHVGDLGLIPGSGRSLRERNDNPLQYKILWTGESSRLQTKGSQRVGNDSATSLSSLFYKCLNVWLENYWNIIWCFKVYLGRETGALFCYIWRSKTLIMLLNVQFACSFPPEYVDLT